MFDTFIIVFFCNHYSTRPFFRSIGLLVFISWISHPGIFCSTSTKRDYNLFSFFSIQDYFQWKWWVGGLAMTIVAILGLIGNSISLTILFRKKIRSVAFNQLLAVLCIVDTIFLLCNSLSCGHALGIDNGKKCLYNFPSKHCI